MWNLDFLKKKIREIRRGTIWEEERDQWEDSGRIKKHNRG
jgi:hypothetical protein